MDNEMEFIYNTRLRRRSLRTGFHARLSATLLNDFERERVGDEDIDPFQDDDDDRDSDYLPEGDASDIENEVNIEPNEIFDSDEEIEEEKGGEMNDVDEANQIDDGFMYGKDGTKWSKTQPAASRIRQHNIMRFRAGPRTQNTVITETNRHGREAIQKWNEQHPDSKQKEWVDLTSTELDAFIGILLASGVAHNNMQDSRLLWRSDALPIFRAPMSHKRFVALCRYIRFDDSRTCAFRQQTDKAAPICDIWNFMNENLSKYYEAHENVIVDEQLSPYRCRTRFTQYIPSKPAKYGMKVWWACDSKTKFPL